mmetsp:Transcript_6215/g.20269  ORF Transcript_6215/g.20269 Transcript_6215/m.20269 type:complete len:308 (+) Transcript_6215:575-1498(+)
MPRFCPGLTALPATVRGSWTFLKRQGTGLPRRSISLVTASRTGVEGRVVQEDGDPSGQRASSSSRHAWTASLPPGVRCKRYNADAVVWAVVSWAAKRRVIKLSTMDPRESLGCSSSRRTARRSLQTLGGALAPWASMASMMGPKWSWTSFLLALMALPNVKASWSMGIKATKPSSHVLKVSTTSSVFFVLQTSDDPSPKKTAMAMSKDRRFVFARMSSMGPSSEKIHWSTWNRTRAATTPRVPLMVWGVINMAFLKERCLGPWATVTASGPNNFWNVNGQLLFTALPSLLKISRTPASPRKIVTTCR